MLFSTYKEMRLQLNHFQGPKEAGTYFQITIHPKRHPIHPLTKCQ